MVLQMETTIEASQLKTNVTATSLPFFNLGRKKRNSDLRF
jgi:hypothetical protein